MDGASLFAGSSGAGGCCGCGGSILPVGGQDLHGERGECGEVVAAPSRRGEPGGAENGRPQALYITPWRASDWLLARLAEKPDLTLRALLKELADRGLVVSYYALWHFLRHEGMTFKKAFARPNRIDRTSPSGASAGRRGRPRLIPPGWFSSTKPGRKPT